MNTFIYDCTKILHHLKLISTDCSHIHREWLVLLIYREMFPNIYYIGLSMNVPASLIDGNHSSAPIACLVPSIYRCWLPLILLN